MSETHTTYHFLSRKQRSELVGKRRAVVHISYHHIFDKNGVATADTEHKT